MALTPEQRDTLVEQITEDGVFTESDALSSLTDNQLVALANPEGLDELVTNMDKMSKEPPKGKGLSEFSDNELSAEMSKRKKKPAGPPTGNASSDDETLTEAEFLAQAPESIRTLVANAQAAEKKEKDELVKKLTANASCEFSEAELFEMTPTQLQRLTKLAGNAQQAGTSPNFAGRFVAPAPTGNATYVEEPLVAPTLDF